MSPVKLTLNATGNIYRPAERGVVTVTVKSTRQDLNTVTDEVQQTAKEIQTVVRSLAKRDDNNKTTSETAIKRWSSSGIITRTWTENYSEYLQPIDTGRLHDSDDGFRIVNPNNLAKYEVIEFNDYDLYETDSNDRKPKIIRRNKSRRLFEATVEILARFCDFEKLSTFVVDMSATDNVSVGDIEWVLTEETEESLQAETVQKAYANVFTKAKAYADAMGMTTIRPVQIDEPDPHHGDTYGISLRGQPMGKKRKQLRLGANLSDPYLVEEESMSVMPEDIMCSATCAVIFEIE